MTAAADLAEARGGGDVHVLVLGGPGAGESAEELAAWGADRIRVAEHERFSEYRAEAWAKVVAHETREGGYEAVVFPATAQGKDLSPRVGALLDVPLATEATGLEVEDGKIVVVRPIYAGKAIARTRVDAEPLLVSIRPNVFRPKERDGAGEVERISPEVEPPTAESRVTGFEASSGELDVAEASIVVSGGRGMQGPENWNLLEELRDAIGDGAGLGASRAVVDAGWRPHAEQVGQTGKTVAPRLYFAIGISGAIQHLAGMRTSGTIVAVNKDPEAPIFEEADYGIVGDLFEVVPRLTEEIRALRDD